MEALYNMMQLQLLEIHENIIHLGFVSTSIYHLVQIVGCINLLDNVLRLYCMSK